jgi:ABC-type polar amino acid transport system ATPase subunit
MVDGRSSASTRVTPAETSRLAMLLRDVADRGPAVLITTRDTSFAEELAWDVLHLESGRHSTLGGKRSLSVSILASDSTRF